MVKLFCALVGAEGSAFSVRVDEGESVGDLKEAIKVKMPRTITCAARKLQLYLAKKGDEWLNSDDTDAVTLNEHGNPQGFDEHGHSQGFEKMDPLLWIKNARYFGENFEPNEGEIHVLVVVPKQEAAQIVSQDGVFDRCSDQFFSQFTTVDEVNSWLEFPSLLPLTKRRKLYVRSAYRVIADQALLTQDASTIAEQALLSPDANMVQYGVITGTPGIGKSVFIYYVMWRLIKDKRRVLFFTAKPAIYFDGRSMLICRQLSFAGNRQFWSPDLWSLVDSVDPTSIAEFPVLNCSTLLASTLRRDCIGEFKKLVPTPDVFYMPLWTKEELARIVPLYPNAAAVWQHRLNCLGGVPRLVLQDIQTDPQALLMSACSSCSLDDCIVLVSIYSEINSIIQTLIHIHSQEPYREYKVAYAPELTMQVIARTKWQSDRTKMQSLLGSCDGNPLAQSLCGYIFEPHTMDLLEQGGTFVCRKLLSGAEMRKRDTIKRKRGTPDSEDEETIDIPRSSQPRQIVERVKVGQCAHQLYVPRTSNYTAIDAWMPHLGGFQMTVGRKHDITAGAADDLAKLGTNSNRLYFLPPPLYYKSFTKKTPQMIEQFAILIPYPEEV